MASPFPGMNPYLEQEGTFHDFHQSFIPLARELLMAQVAPRYLVKVEVALFIHELPAEERRFLGRADVGVTGPESKVAPYPGSAGIAVAPGPVSIQLEAAVDVERHSFLEIRDRTSRELVTVIELLSPANKKAGGDREQYLAKRRDVLKSGAHLVEIDLLRGWTRLPPDVLSECDYYVIVSRAEQRPAALLWPLRLQNRLPEIPIPLHDPDHDAKLDLQQVLDRLYDAAGYEYYIYDTPPQPALDAQQTTWAQRFIPRANSADTLAPPPQEGE